ncbi:iron complex transport system ATP-binding protein [Candidatus Termititenax persephonae]|uniref:Iron complex transport system ATP-binding protein n=1 Tax=Candidatus Termititenax persephonae TaxID=2218525 RepID=A0A388TH73_9BACT|nr:iron complex transport system ATP-binding protein [Candidatus Termititenax persephonae]
MYTLEKVSYSFEKPVLDNVSLEIPDSKLIGILGPNGSGKTTLLRLLSGFYRAEQGSVLLNGQNVAETRPRLRARQIAVVTQISVLNPQFTVREMLALGRAPYRRWFWQRQTAAEQALLEKITVDLKLSEFLPRRLKTLSGGELQRTVIARALIQDTPILLLDEPVNHLDIHQQIEILRYLQNLAATGRTVIAILHDLRLARKFCDSLLAVENGKVIPADTTEILARVFDLPEDSEFLQ